MTIKNDKIYGIAITVDVAFEDATSYDVGYFYNINTHKKSGTYSSSADLCKDNTITKAFNVCRNNRPHNLYIFSEEPLVALDPNEVKDIYTDGMTVYVQFNNPQTMDMELAILDYKKYPIDAIALNKELNDKLNKFRAGEDHGMKKAGSLILSEEDNIIYGDFSSRQTKPARLPGLGAPITAKTFS